MFDCRSCFILVLRSPPLLRAGVVCIASCACVKRWACRSHLPHQYEEYQYLGEIPFEMSPAEPPNLRALRRDSTRYAKWQYRIQTLDSHTLWAYGMFIIIHREDMSMDMHTIDPTVAFDHAVKVGAFGLTQDDNHAHEPWPCPCPWFGYVGDFMYMYSDAKLDYFKHIDTREYVTVPRMGE